MDSIIALWALDIYAEKIRDFISGIPSRMDNGARIRIHDNRQQVGDVTEVGSNRSNNVQGGGQTSASASMNNVKTSSFNGRVPHIRDNSTRRFEGSSGQSECSGPPIHICWYIIGLTLWNEMAMEGPPIMLPPIMRWEWGKCR
ncbi:hypothetical protein Tco_1075267 [Tanacetum coccineum]